MGEIINNKVIGNVVVEKDLTLTGIIDGNVEVKPNTEFVITGIVIGNLNIYEGSIVLLKGIINGDIINNGGELKIFGVVNGRLFREKGNTYIDEKAIVQNM